LRLRQQRIDTRGQFGGHARQAGASGVVGNGCQLPSINPCIG
jgi:hypothetical protein